MAYMATLSPLMSHPVIYVILLFSIRSLRSVIKAKNENYITIYTNLLFIAA